MILRNKKGIERKFRLLFEVDSKNNKYLIYEDINTLNVYGGRLNKNNLSSLNDSEYEFLNNMLDRLVGR